MKLAEAYNQGDGVRTDFQQAFAYYQRAANKGNIEAAYNLGMMYRAGIGVDSSLKEAAKWYEMAAMRWAICNRRSIWGLFMLLARKSCRILNAPICGSISLRLPAMKRLPAIATGWLPE